MSRPSDHIDSEAPAAEGPDRVNSPRLGPIGWLRWVWRQLTNMRTALFLLLLLAIAAVPGSLVPQTSSDPNGVAQYKLENPTLAPIVNAVQGFDVYSSVWFSSIYLLLFISLVGCVVPRTKHHWQAMRAAPPRTPARLDRLTVFTTRTSKASSADAIASATALLRKRRYRVAHYSFAKADSVSAERGYLRETGNLVFHGALVGILIAVGFGGGFGFSGQKIVVEGQSYVNYIGGFDSYNSPRFGATLTPYSLQLDKLTTKYEESNIKAFGQPLDYNAYVTTKDADGKTAEANIKVNEPLHIGDTDVYLLGNGYAPVITVRDADGNVTFSEPVPFLPQDTKLTSVGVVKVPDGPKQLGFVGFFYPTSAQLDSGAYTSVFPSLGDPLLTLNVYTGDLGLDEGTPKSVYVLDTTTMTQVTGGKTGVDSIELKVGDTQQLPDNLGSVSLDSVKRFASFDIHHDPTQGWVLIFAILVVAGLLTSLFIPRRRLWVKVREDSEGETVIEYAALARGDDPGLETALKEFADEHSSTLDTPKT